MGSTGPLSRREPRRHLLDEPWGTDFPPVTIRDMVRAQKRLVEHLGIDRLFAVIGGSMGGMQALQWAAQYPDHVFAALPIAAASYHSAQNIAFHEVGRQAIFADPDWHCGRYWEKQPDSRARPGGGADVRAHHLSVRGSPDTEIRAAAAERAERHLRGDQPVRRDVRGGKLPAPPGQHLRAALRRQQLPDHHPRDGLFRPRRRLRRRRSRARVQGHGHAVPAGVASPPTGCFRPPRAAPSPAR